MIQVVQDWRPLWPWVRTGLEEVMRRCTPSWIPEDVYAELKSGVSGLVTIADESGFAIVKRLQDYDGQVFFVWALWGEDLSDRQDEITQALAELAKQAGCKRMQMRSPRKGWGRVGWTERETVYEREI